SDAAQLVAKAFLNASLRADFSLQNAGGVREALMKGDVSNQTAYTILPFSNTLVNLNITGREVVAALEDAVKNASFGIDGQAPSTGA
ncbi:5'-nucleotidase C-terminal domain-containing protein, partial [Klebsiella pneumoniae]|uniref:5'-nucleotidase C-terminal domain-containing protein n=1 Tax=Klebsiella pneumoniae TaxID=573 RepID=UPI003977101B